VGEEFVELELDGAGVAVLAVLDQEDEQEATTEATVFRTTCQVSE
jgi:hypothetical protein